MLKLTCGLIVLVGVLSWVAVYAYRFEVLGALVQHIGCAR